MSNLILPSEVIGPSAHIPRMDSYDFRSFRAYPFRSSCTFESAACLLVCGDPLVFSQCHLLHICLGLNRPLVLIEPLHDSAPLKVIPSVSGLSGRNNVAV